MTTPPKLRKILYVEDEPDIQQVVQMALEAVGGFEVKVGDSGEVALREVGPFAPDLILLDAMMPGMDGVQTLKALRALDDAMAEIPVVFITAKVQPQEVQKYRDLGAADVISKPFDPMTLSSQVDAIWGALQG